MKQQIEITPETKLELLPTLLTVEEVSKFLRVTKQIVYKEIREGRLRCIRIGKMIRVPKEVLSGLLNI